MCTLFRSADPSFDLSHVLEEVLGYHTTLNADAPGSGSVAGYYGVAGCRRPNDWVDRGCMQGVPRQKRQRFFLGAVSRKSDGNTSSWVMFT